jgi:hydroxyacylglutathione hydrolase
MYIEQLYTGCLAQGAYYIESNGQAAIIDPLRDSQIYIDKAKERAAQIKYIFETHFHADFVSGHADLARQTGAKIVYGPTQTSLGFEAHKAIDAEVFTLGDCTITAIHTPGHTPESTCYLLKDADGNNHALFTGDTLFIGDVGRPDLAQKSEEGVTSETLAASLFHSLRNKIMVLEDHVIVYPAHGAGSACGKNMSKETSDTLGNQKKTNYALRSDMTEQEFVSEVLDGLAAPPAYFPDNVKLNIMGYDSLDAVYERSLVGLSPVEFEQKVKESGALVLDTRAPQVFCKAFIPHAINIGIDGGFAPWVGSMIERVDQKIAIVADPGREKEVITRLARVGFDHTIAFLEGGMDAWISANMAVDSIESISAENLAEIVMQNPNAKVVDVRKPGEYEAEHYVEATLCSLDEVKTAGPKLSKEDTTYVHCAGGYRSMIFISYMRKQGYKNLVDVAGGFAAIKKQDGIKTTAFVCPSTLKG